MTFTTRQATVSDIILLNQLAQLSVRQIGGKYYSAQQVESSLKYLFGIDTLVVTDGTYYIAEERKQVVACGGWSHRKTLFDGDQASELLDRGLRDSTIDPAVIRAFYVHPN
ncbi:MAG: hypothetical protein WBA23_24425 [Tunicatimonas sp.]|uniref:hypothetical protein n=1 Tax=Tunicatimonas sp. TaxID=1940096 RepID=UPI003C75D980